MKIYHGFSDKHLKKRKRCVAIGIFDGVHLAHRRIVRNAVRASRKARAVPTLVTFHPHPRKVLSRDKKSPPILMSLEHRLRVIASLGIREAVIVPFTKKFSRVSRESFLKECLRKKLGMVHLSVGHDFCFGRDAAGGADYLASEAGKNGFGLFVCPAVKSQGQVISSTKIRLLIERGALDRAGRMLGRRVSVYGTVVQGRGRGRGLGFATANLDPHHETLPPDGVYAVFGDLEGHPVKGVLHIGKKPTFGERERSVEAHLFGQKHDLYGKELELFFVKRLRSTRRFGSAAELARAVRRDIQRAVFTLQGPFQPV